MQKEKITIDQLVNKTKEWLINSSYSSGYLQHFSATTNRLLKYAANCEITYFTTDVGIEFLEVCYSISQKYVGNNRKPEQLRHIQILSEYQLHGSIMVKERRRSYCFPQKFKEAADGFIQHRIFVGIVPKSIQINKLYLERFFNYLCGNGIDSPSEITIKAIHGFVLSLYGFSKPTGNHMLRTVREFMKYCFQNGCHMQDLSGTVPHIYYDKTARIPSSYSASEVEKLLASVDRGNPGGKRDYAILLIIVRLGIRSSDIRNLKFENFYWEQERLRFVQQKTGYSISLSLFEDIGQSIIDYIKYGRPDSTSSNIFIRHRAPFQVFCTSAIYSLVHRYMLKAGIYTETRKSGPHALRHSLASRLLEHKIPLPIISEILGHADSNTTLIYLKMDVEQLRKCALEVAL